MRAKEFLIDNRIGSSKKLPTLQKRNYSSWIQSKLKGKLDEKLVTVDPSLEDEVRKFADWSAKVLNIKQLPKITLSMDTEQAQSNPGTGMHTIGGDDVWIYVNNRNLIDILRTVFHELVHFRQGELGMIDPKDSYPGSPIEAMADMLAGKYIKIYGKQNRHVYQ